MEEMMTAQSSDSELDSIITDLTVGHYGWAHDQLDGTSFIADELKLIAERESKAKAALLAWNKQRVLEARLNELKQIGGKLNGNRINLIDHYEERHTGLTNSINALTTRAESQGDE